MCFGSYYLFPLNLTFLGRSHVGPLFTNGENKEKEKGKKVAHNIRNVHLRHTFDLDHDVTYSDWRHTNKQHLQSRLSDFQTSSVDQLDH